MDVANLRPAQRQHLSGSVELHGAGAQRNHSAVQRQILDFQHLHVTHHLGLGVILAEDLMLHERALTGQFGRDVQVGNTAFAVADVRGERLASSGGQHFEDVVDIVVGDGFVEGDGETTLAVVAEVDFFRQSHFLHVLAGKTFGRFEAKGVEVVFVILFETVFCSFGSQNASQNIDLHGFVLQTICTVPHAVEACHDGGQSAGGADVGGCALAFDVLLAGLQGHTHGAVALCIDGDTDDTAGHLAQELLAASVEASGRATIAHRDTETLGGTDHTVSAPLARRREQCQSQQVSSHAHEDVLGVRFLNPSVEVVDAAPIVRVLDHRTEEGLVEFHLVGFANHKLDAVRRSVGLHHTDGVRENAFSHKVFHHVVFLLLAAAAAEEHQHHLTSSGGVVQHGSVGQRHGSQAADHRLVVQQSLDTALGNLSLVRSVGGVPARILENIAQNHRRGVGVVSTHTDVGAVNLVLRHQAVDVVEVFALGHAVGKIQRLGQADGGRNRLLNQFVHRLDADDI